MKDIFNKYPASKLSATIKNYDEIKALYKRMDIYNKKRFVILPLIYTVI